MRAISSSSRSSLTVGRHLALAARRPLGGLAKRVFDIGLGSALLIFFAPFFLLIAVAMRLLDPGPVFFSHERIGYRGRRFRCLKFRTMVVDADHVLDALLKNDPIAAEEWAQAQKLRNDPRITALGRFLRDTSLDELPQLFNVVRGEMSLVGPRPIVHAEAARYGPHFRDYRRARPGLTGLWQVSGRSDCSYPERVRLDVDYLRNWSLVFDALMLFRTVTVVLSRKGAR